MIEREREKEMESQCYHILMVPFLAQGHFCPFLHLALALCRCRGRRRCFIITIVTTPLNAARLRSSLPGLPDGIQIVALPFDGAVHGLPPDIESTDKLPIDQFVNLFSACASLEPHLRRFIAEEVLNEGKYRQGPTVEKSGQPPICIIFDSFCSWANIVAQSFGCPGIALATGGAYGSAAYLCTWKDLPQRNYSDEEDFPLPGFPDNHRFHRSQIHSLLRYADGIDKWSKAIQPLMNMSMESAGWLCNTVEEIEPIGLEIFRNYVKSPVWAVGPLIPPAILSGGRETTPLEKSAEQHPCMKFLDLQEAESVLYISFGSQNTIMPTQMMELAKGLERSGRPFLWVIRPPFGFDVNGEFRQEWLPEGFEERVREKKQGMLVHKWGPQLEILKHRSTGAVLSHCGWNSVLEGLSQGLPIVGWPLAGEQAYNSKMMVEQMGVAVELTRGYQGEVEEEEVKAMAQMVLEREGKGGEMKRRAEEAAKKLRAAVREATEEEVERQGSSVKALDDFVATILS